MTDSQALFLPECTRPASTDELASISWWTLLGPAEQALVARHLRVGRVEPGERVCQVGQPAHCWFGVLEGLLKLNNDETGGAPAVTFTGLPPGAWFGEGALLRHAPYRYNAQALRNSSVASLPKAQFEALLSQSIAFNRFVLNQLNERLSHFITARETDRASDPDLRVARNLASLFHPTLYPGVGSLLRITQQELAYLVGLSRQRTNLALQHLQDSGLIRVEYGGVRVLELESLRGYHSDTAAAA